MDFQWTDEHRAFRNEVRAFIETWRTPELLEEYSRTYGAQGPLIKKFHHALSDKGWMRMCWSVEQGGEGRNLLYNFILIDEMEYYRMPYGNLSVTSIAPAIAAHGSDDQKKEYLPDPVFMLKCSKIQTRISFERFRGNKRTIMFQKIYFRPHKHISF